MQAKVWRGSQIALIESKPQRKKAVSREIRTVHADSRFPAHFGAERVLQCPISAVEMNPSPHVWFWHCVPGFHWSRCPGWVYCFIFRFSLPSTVEQWVTAARYPFNWQLLLSTQTCKICRGRRVHRRPWMVQTGCRVPQRLCLWHKQWSDAGQIALRRQGNVSHWRLVYSSTVPGTRRVPNAQG